jgi:hypothetical protein
MSPIPSETATASRHLVARERAPERKQDFCYDGDHDIATAAVRTIIVILSVFAA